MACQVPERYILKKTRQDILDREVMQLKKKEEKKTGHFKQFLCSLFFCLEIGPEHLSSLFIELKFLKFVYKNILKCINVLLSLNKGKLSFLYPEEERGLV